MQNRHISAAAALTAGLVLLTPAIAGAASTPPPPGTAEAVAAQVGTLVALSKTEAKAEPTGPSAKASAIEVGGQPPSAEFGGSQKGPGKSSGHLADTGKTPVGQLTVTPWSASGAQGGDGNQADADAALARLILGDDLLTVNVVQSSSHAAYNGSASSGKSSSDGATVETTGLTLLFLHSEASSSGKGYSEIANINGTGILTSGDANGTCALTVPSVLMLNCLTASGGIGEAAAGVLDAMLGSGSSSISAAAFQAGAKAGISEASVLAEPPLSRPAPAATPASAPRGALPFTGFGVKFAASVGVSLIALGFALMVPGRVRRLAGTGVRTPLAG